MAFNISSLPMFIPLCSLRKLKLICPGPMTIYCMRFVSVKVCLIKTHFSFNRYVSPPLSLLRSVRCLHIIFHCDIIFFSFSGLESDWK